MQDLDEQQNQSDQNPDNSNLDVPNESLGGTEEDKSEKSIVTNLFKT